MQLLTVLQEEQKFEYGRAEGLVCFASLAAMAVQLVACSKEIFRYPERVG